MINLKLWSISEVPAIAIEEPVLWNRIMHLTIFSDPQMSLYKFRE